ncbi:hypothetical protein Tco_1334989 [Tanacetum coccineum]
MGMVGDVTDGVTAVVALAVEGRDDGAAVVRMAAGVVAGDGDGDDVGRGGRLLDWPEVARDGRRSPKIERQKGG